MKIAKIQNSKIVNIKNPSNIKKGIVLTAALITSTKEAAAHAAPFFHMHDSNGKVIGMAAGVVLFIGALAAAGYTMYKKYNGKPKNAEEKVDNK